MHDVWLIVVAALVTAAFLALILIVQGLFPGLV